MYDALWEEHPKVRRIRAEGFAEGFAESFVGSFSKHFAEDFIESFGKHFAESFAKSFGEHFGKSIADGETKREVAVLQRMLVRIVSLRFPALSDMALLEVQQFNNPEELDRLVEQAATAPDEATARRQLLGPPTA